MEATQFLRHAEFVLPCKVQVPKGAFARYDFGQGNLPSHLRAEKGRVLSRWRDAGWGEIVAEGKASGRFSDELVDAAAVNASRALAPFSSTDVGDVCTLIDPSRVGTGFRCATGGCVGATLS